MKKIYHIISPEYVSDHSLETTSFGLKTILPNAITLCKRKITENNLLAFEGYKKCIRCNNIESKLTITNNFNSQHDSIGCFVYWDMSNIYIGAQNTGAKYEGEKFYGNIRLNYQNIIYFIESILNIYSITVVGSNTRSIRGFLQQLEDKDYLKINIIENDIIESKERFADESLQIKMLHDMIDYKPNTAVVLTGDGNGINQEIGFFNEIKRMHRLGWDIVLMAWDNSCHKDMKSWVKKNGEFIALDDYYYYITYQNPTPDNKIWRSSAQFDNIIQ